MKTFDYQEFLDRATSMAGLDSAALSTTERKWFDTWFNRNIGFAWDACRWPWACHIESRTCTASVVQFTETNKTDIDDVFECYLDDPTAFTIARTVPYRIEDDQLRVIYPSSVTPIYVYFREPAIVVSGSQWVAQSYAINASVWHTVSGVINYYKANASVVLTDIPGTSSKWTLIELPREMLECVAHAVYADYLRFDGQVDKATTADSEADSILFNAIDKFERQNRQFQSITFNTHINSRGYR